MASEAAPSFQEPALGSDAQPTLVCQMTTQITLPYEYANGKCAKSIFPSQSLDQPLPSRSLVEQNIAFSHTTAENPVLRNIQ